ncbi:MAG: hypothetical protein IKG14_02790 [Clostridia bacterium]|nr:hypothetical protein [Clostridia bacterium]
MKKVARVLVVLMLLLGTISLTPVYASNQIISNETKSKLVEIKDKELKSIEDYKATYGDGVYGTVGYILNKIRIYSIPLTFLGIAISVIYQFVLGARHAENLYKGFNSMIVIVSLFVICQVLPLVFAIVIKGWRG